MEENEIREKNEKKVKHKRTHEKKNSAALASIISLFVGAIGMYLLVYYVLPGETNTVINKSEKEVTITDQGIADAVEKLYDAVVVVEVYSNNTLAASGTGFVYKTAGNKAYILTNDHVVNTSYKSDVKIMFTNGKKVEAKVEGSDAFSDLAVLSVDEKEIITVAEIGKSEDLRLGDTAFAIGAPLDTEYYWSVTRGIISGKDRMVEVSLNNSKTSDYVMKVLQTDASINSGNSGGPLANSNGEVIGITNMKLVSSGVEGIGFAIPIEDAVTYAESIINGETLKRPLLGVEMLNLSNTYELYNNKIVVNTELTAGVVVVKVQDKSPAEAGGLTRGDIIIAVDDEPVANVAKLRYSLYKHTVGDTIKVTIERNGKKQDIKVKLTVASE